MPIAESLSYPKMFVAPTMACSSTVIEPSSAKQPEYPPAKTSALSICPIIRSMGGRVSVAFAFTAETTEPAS